MESSCDFSNCFLVLLIPLIHEALFTIGHVPWLGGHTGNMVLPPNGKELTPNLLHLLCRFLFEPICYGLDVDLETA